MLLDESLFETTNSLEDQLKEIDYVKKVEFDDDGLGQTIILTHFDDSIYDIQGSNYFKVRDKVIKQILNTIRSNGYVMADPVEDNDTYLYLVYRKKNMQEALNIDVEGKLNNFLNDNKLYPEVWREGNNIYVSIHWGDWKHEHLRLQYLVTEFSKANDINIEHIDTQITEEDGSDTYSAIHTFTIKEEEMTEDLNKQASDYIIEVYSDGSIKEYSYNDENEAIDHFERLDDMMDSDLDDEEIIGYAHLIRNDEDIVTLEDIRYNCDPSQDIVVDSAIDEYLDAESLEEDLTDKINQQLDDKNANFEKDKQATRDMRQELAKQGIATDMEGNPLNEDQEPKFDFSTVVKDSYNHFVNDLGRTPTVSEMLDDITNNYDGYENIQDSIESTNSWYSALAAELGRQDLEVLDESLEEDVKSMTLQEFANKIRFNGARNRESKVPGEIDIYINQINIPDNMRMKSLDAEAINDDTIQVDYITQMPFNPDQANEFIIEFERAICSMIEFFDFEMPFDIALNIQARDGKDYGYVVRDLDFNKSGDVKADNLKSRIEQTIKNIEEMDEEASSYEAQADRCLEKGNEEGYQYYKEHADELRRNIDRAAAYLSSLEEE